MAKFPVDAPKRKVVKALERLGFQTVRKKSTFLWYVKTQTEAKFL